MIQSYINWLMRHRWLVMISSIVLSLILASGGRLLVFDNDYRIFFDGDNPQLLAFEDLQATYTKNDNALFALVPKDGNAFSREALAAVIDLTEKAWHIPYSLRVDSVSNFQYSYAEGDDLSVIDLVENPQELSDEELKKIRKIALSEPLLAGRLVSRDADITAVNVTLELPGLDQAGELPEAVAKIRELEHYLRETYPDFDIYLSGIVMLNDAFPTAMIRDLTQLNPIALIAILTLVFLLLRNITGTFASISVIVLSVLAAMGSAGWIGYHLSPPVMTAPTIILTLAVADSVHILSNWSQGLRQGKNTIEAMTESLRINMTPVFLTSITTAIGFLSLNFSDAPPFRILGNISALGVVYAWLLSITVLPALVTLLPTRIRPDTESKSVTPRLDRFADKVILKRKPLFWAMGVIIVLLIAFIPRNELNDIFVEYFDETIQFRTDTDFIVDNLTGIYLIDYSLDSKVENGVSDPEFLQDVESFGNWLRTQPEVLHVNSITDIMKRLNRNMHGDDPQYYRLPEQKDLAAQYLLLYEMSLPYGLDLNNQIDINKQSTRLTVTMKTISTKNVLAFEERVANWMQANTPEIQTIGSSPTVMFSHIGNKNIRSMLIGTFVAFLMISLILIIAFKSWRYGLLSLIPNLAPAAMAFGLWGIINGQIGLSLSIVAAMTMGIVVDDTVHFLSKYLRGIREQALAAEQAVRYAFHTVGNALVVTTAALIAGFLVLSTSAFEINAGMGLLVAIVVGIALVVDFLFLPPLLIKLDEWLHR